MYINYDHYRIFYYVAKYGSFTRAAEVLLGSQPNITRTVKTLEGELGCTLFSRTNKGVKLTPEGEALYRHISIAMEHIAMGEEEISETRSLETGVVSVAASEVALHCFLLPVLKEFHREHPGIRIRISNHTTPQAVDALTHGLAEIALVTGPLLERERLRRVPLKHFREIAVCGRSMRDLAEKPRTHSDLCRYPLVCLSPQSGTYEFYARIFADRQLELRPDIEVATADQLLPMIKSELGVGFVPEELAADSIAAGELYRIDLVEKLPQRTIYMLCDRTRPQSFAARSLEENIRLKSSLVAAGVAENGRDGGKFI